MLHKSQCTKYTMSLKQKSAITKKPEINDCLNERLLQMAEIIGHFFSYALFLNSEKHYTIPNAINELSSLILSAVLIKIDP